MARTEVTPVKVPRKFATSMSDITFEAADSTEGNKFPATGSELLILHNTDTSSQTVTVVSTPDSFGRVGDIDAYSIPASGYAITQKFSEQGWAQDDGYIYFDASADTVEVAVIKQPY